MTETSGEIRWFFCFSDDTQGIFAYINLYKVIFVYNFKEGDTALFHGYGKQ